MFARKNDLSARRGRPAERRISTDRSRNVWERPLPITFVVVILLAVLAFKSGIIDQIVTNMDTHASLRRGYSF